MQRIIDGVEKESQSHEIDHVRTFPAGTIAFEIEWNNKDPFFDRDLENFKRLHAEGAISVGIIVTRGPTLHEQMWDFVARFASDQSIRSFTDLDRLDIQLTRRKRSEIQKRVERQKNPKALGRTNRGVVIDHKTMGTASVMKTPLILGGQSKSKERSLGT